MTTTKKLPRFFLKPGIISTTIILPTNTPPLVEITRRIFIQNVSRLRIYSKKSEMMRISISFSMKEIRSEIESLLFNQTLAESSEVMIRYCSRRLPTNQKISPLARQVLVPSKRTCKVVQKNFRKLLQRKKLILQLLNKIQIYREYFPTLLQNLQRNSEVLLLV